MDFECDSMNKPFYLLILIHTTCLAQQESIKQIAQQTSTENLKNNLYYLASDPLESRLMASHGDTLASLFIADGFRINHLVAPYDNGKNYFQSITAVKTISKKEILLIADKEFARWAGWVMVNRQNINRSDIRVVFAGYGLNDSLYDDFKDIDVKDKAVIVLPRQPRRNETDSSLKLSKSTRFFAKMASLREKGAALILYYDPVFQEDLERNRKSDSTTGQYINSNDINPPVPVIIISEERINELLASDRTNIKLLQDSINKTLKPASFDLKQSLTIDVESHLQEVHAPNVIGIIYGRDSSSGNVIVTAHHDHLGKYGTTIYHGASDDASGTAAMMEMAVLMNNTVSRGLVPKRTIIFISTTGEEGGNLGSLFYAEHPLFPTNNTFAHINLDLLGRIDSAYINSPDSNNYAFVLIKDSKENDIESALENANHLLSLKINKSYNNISADVMLKRMGCRFFYTKKYSMH